MARPRTGYPGYLPVYERDLHVPGSMSNADNTVPFPLPDTIPVPGWSSGAPVRLGFSAGPSPVLGAEAVRTATWASPLFDLRPERRGADPQQGSARGQPVWLGGSNLYVFIFGLQRVATGLTNLVVNVIEDAAVGSADLAQSIQAPQDVSDQFVGVSQNATLLVITPPGSGAPPRYWRVTIVFDKLDVTDPPDFEIQAAYY